MHLSWLIHVQYIPMKQLGCLFIVFYAGKSEKHVNGASEPENHLSNQIASHATELSAA